MKMREILALLRKGFEDLIATLQSQKKDSEVIKIAQEMTKTTYKEIIQERIRKLREKISIFSGLFDKDAEISQIIQQKVSEKAATLREEKNALNTLIETLSTDKISMRTVKIQAKKYLKASGERIDFLREVVKKRISDVQHNLRGFKAVTGLAVSLAILPFTCIALNWLYPRIMEKFFPSLVSGSNKNPEAKK